MVFYGRHGGRPLLFQPAARLAGVADPMEKRRFLVTAALPYSNGRLHVGNIAGAYLPADTYVRYLRATGAEVRFICGSDDNGVAALKTAREQNRPVEDSAWSDWGFVLSVLAPHGDSRV